MSKLTKEFEKKIIDILRKNCYWDKEDDGYFTYCIQPQGYDDEIADDVCAKILTADDPHEALNEYLSEMAFTDVENYYRDSLWNDIHKDIDDLIMSEFEDYNDAIDEVNEFIDEHVEWWARAKDWDREICLNIIVDSGDANYDYSCNNILNYCGELPIKENSSILWLAKQQGKELEFRKAIADYPEYCRELERTQEGAKEMHDLFVQKYHFSQKMNEREENLKIAQRLAGIMKEQEKEVQKEYGYDTFILSLIEELENLSSCMGALTFCVKTTLLQAIDVLSKKKDITLSKDTTVGLFDPWNGGGSCMDIVGMEKDIVIPYENIGRVWMDVYRRDKYDCIHDVYGVSDGMWTGQIVA